MVWCAKCGSASQEDTALTFHRFPQPSVHCSLKTKVWAVFSFPDEDWSEYKSLYELYRSHKMLCSKHFDDSSFTSSARKRLNQFAIPTEARGILAKLRDQQNPRDEQYMEPRNHLQSGKIEEFKSIIELKKKKIRRLQAHISHYERRIIDLEGAAEAKKQKSYVYSDHVGFSDFLQQPIYYND